MPDFGTSTLVLLVSIAAGLVFLNALVRIVRRGEWSSAAWMAFLVTIMTSSLVAMVATYTDAWVPVTDVLRNVTYVLPEWGRTFFQLLEIFVAVAAGSVFVLGIRKRDAMLNVPAILLLVTTFIAMAVAVLHQEFPMRPQSILYLSILVAAVVAPRGLGIHIGIATAALAVAVASGIALTTHSDFSVIDCAGGPKCGVLGFIFRGVLDNENALGLFLALAMPFIYMGFGGWQGLVLTVYALGLVLITGSRTGSLAAVVTLCVLVVVRPTVRQPVRAPVRSALLTVGILGVFILGLFVPFTARDATSYSGRAFLWEVARDALAKPSTLIYGEGMFGWDELRASGVIDFSAIYSAHNQWLHVLFSTGLVGLGFFLAAILALFWEARHGYYTVVACVLIPFFVLGVTERPWPIDTIDWLAWSVPGALLCYPRARADSTEEFQRRVPLTEGDGVLESIT